MPKRRNVKAEDLAGLFIYQEPRNRTVFYDIVTRKGYLLNNVDVRTYTVYTAMLPLCTILALGLMSLFKLSGIQALGIFAAFYLLSELLFRFLFFWKRPVLPKFDPSAGGGFIASLSQKFSKQRLTALIVLLAGLDILMPLYAFTAKLEGITLYALYGITAIAVAGTIIAILALSAKNRK